MSFLFNSPFFFKFSYILFMNCLKTISIFRKHELICDNCKKNKKMLGYKDMGFMIAPLK